jgi:hypothetical protein
MPHGGSRDLRLPVLCEEEVQRLLKIAARFKRDPNNGRPRYIGLKVRVKGPPKLAVVAGRG